VFGRTAKNPSKDPLFAVIFIEKGLVRLGDILKLSGKNT